MKTFKQFLKESKQLDEDFSKNDILKRIKLLSKYSNYEDLQPVLYQGSLRLKDELVVYYNPETKYDDMFSIISYTDGRERAANFATEDEFKSTYNRFYSPKALKTYGKNQKVFFEDPIIKKFNLSTTL